MLLNILQRHRHCLLQQQRWWRRLPVAKLVCSAATICERQAKLRRASIHLRRAKNWTKVRGTTTPVSATRRQMAAVGRYLYFFIIIVFLSPLFACVPIKIDNALPLTDHRKRSVTQHELIIVEREREESRAREGNWKRREVTSRDSEL